MTDSEHLSEVVRLLLLAKEQLRQLAVSTDNEDVAVEATDLVESYEGLVDATIAMARNNVINLP